jgi:hypothetical protein
MHALANQRKWEMCNGMENGEAGLGRTWCVFLHAGAFRVSSSLRPPGTVHFRGGDLTGHRKESLEAIVDAILQPEDAREDVVKGEVFQE